MTADGWAPWQQNPQSTRLWSLGFTMSLFSLLCDRNWSSHLTNWCLCCVLGSEAAASDNLKIHPSKSLSSGPIRCFIYKVCPDVLVINTKAYSQPSLWPSVIPPKLRTHNPVQSASQKELTHTFYELQCQPTGLFWYGIIWCISTIVNGGINNKSLSLTILQS